MADEKYIGDFGGEENPERGFPPLDEEQIANEKAKEAAEKAKKKEKPEDDGG